MSGALFLRHIRSCFAVCICCVKFLFVLLEKRVELTHLVCVNISVRIHDWQNEYLVFVQQTRSNRLQVVYFVQKLGNYCAFSFIKVFDWRKKLKAN